MYVSNCPRCHDTFRVPLGDFSKGARAQCPWCGEEFPLAEVLNQLPPVLRIVSTDPTFAAESGDQSDNIDRSDDLVTSAPKVQAKRRAKSSGGLRNVIGVIAGGLFAVPIAGVILWGLGKRPFADLGGSIGDRVTSKAVDTPGETALFLPEVDASTTADDTAAAAQANQAVRVGDLDLQSESDELVSTVEIAVKMVNAINRLKADDARRNDYVTTAYRTIAKASELASTEGPSIEKLAQSVRESKVLDQLEIAGSDWIDTSARNNEGVLIIGASDGQAVTLSSGKKVSVLGAHPLPTSGRVMVLGRISSNESIDAIWVESF